MEAKKNGNVIKKLAEAKFLLFLLLLPALCRAQNPKDMIAPDTARKDTSNQRDIIEIAIAFFHIHLKNPEEVEGRKVYYSFLPLSSAVPGGGNALVTATTAGFYLGNRRKTYLSSVTFSPSYNFGGQFVFPFRSNIWSNGNRWNFQGDTRYSIYPQYTWGIGGGQPENDKILIRYKYLRFYQDALKRIRPWLMAGIGYSLDYHFSIQSQYDSLDLKKFTGYPFGTANHSHSFSSGLTLNFLYDNRNNAINPLPGTYANIVYRINPRFLGSDISWHSLYLDLRKYIPLSRKGQNTLAFWSYLWTALGSNTPYLDLPAIGWDSYQKSGRGFYPSRYTGKTLYYFETEYRRDITNDGLFGFVVFANLNSVAEMDTHRFEYLHPAGGAGLRIKFNKKSATNITFDYGISKGNSGLSIGLGEAF